MLQLLGGVAVAGAVAAGTTAFTAGSGLADNTGLTSKTALYGGADFSVVGASLDGLVISSSTNNDDVDKITVTLKNAADNASLAHASVAVSMVVTGGGTAGAAGHTTDCAWVSGDDWACTPHAAAEVWNAITNIGIVVTDA
jgi:hypothetical protein